MHEREAELEQLRERVEDLERQAKETEARYRTLVEASFEGLAISVDRVLVYGNQAFADIFGYGMDELVGLSPARLATRESQELIAQNVRAGIETPYEVTCFRKDGSTFPCELLGRNTTYRGERARLTGFRDLTEQRRQKEEQERREEQVRHAQKLETLGVLAGGIAHDFNNLLTIVIANAGMAARTLNQPKRVKRNLDQIHEAVHRAGDLTNQLLVYAGRGTREKAPVRLSLLVQDAMELLRVSVSKKAALRCELAEDLPVVEADPGQLRQVIMNLIINASDALEDHAGDVVVTTGTIDADVAYLAGSFADEGMAPGTYVYAAVADNGAGMDAATLRRIFDPFYTTKVDGRGLGLATVQGIVRAHGGAIKVDTTLGIGTTFRVLLPTARGRHADDRENRTPATSTTPTIIGTVLLADDEAAIAQVVQEVLENVGCQVLLASDGNQAVSLFRKHSDEINLLILDLTMPQKDGLEVLSEIREIDADIPAILASGYTERKYQEVLDADPKASFLHKPFDPELLITMVRDKLD